MTIKLQKVSWASNISTWLASVGAELLHVPLSGVGVLLNVVAWLLLLLIN